MHLLQRATMAASAVLALNVPITSISTQAQAASPSSSQDCRSFPVVAAVSGISFYTDKAGSRSDPALVAANQKALGGVRDFMACLERALDKPEGGDQLKNAFQVLRIWANANAILQPAPDTEGRVQRVFFSAGFGLIILKFRYRGLPDDPVINSWFANLAAAVRDDYQNFHGNVLPFAGATNALSALVSGDKAGYAFQDHAWRMEIGDIQDNGVLAPELARAARATVYHELAASGLLLLHSTRQALGIPDDPASMTKLKALTGLIGKSLCHPDEIAQLAGGVAQEVPGKWAYRLPFAFGLGLLPQGWFQCVPPQTDFNALDYGGDTRLSAQAVVAAGRSRKF